MKRHGERPNLFRSPAFVKAHEIIRRYQPRQAIDYAALVIQQIMDAIAGYGGDQLLTVAKINGDGRDLSFAGPMEDEFSRNNFAIFDCGRVPDERSDYWRSSAVHPNGPISVRTKSVLSPVWPVRGPSPDRCANTACYQWRQFGRRLVGLFPVCAALFYLSIFLANFRQLQ